MISVGVRCSTLATLIGEKLAPVSVAVDASPPRSSWISILMPTPAGTHPSPNAAANATFALNPVQCIGRMYAGGGSS